MMTGRKTSLFFFMLIFTVFSNLLFIGNSNAYSPASFVITGPSLMFKSATHTFTASGGCGEPYTWSIISGEGSLSSTTGASVNYTAPASNAICDKSPIICATDYAGEKVYKQIQVITTMNYDRTVAYYYTRPLERNPYPCANCEVGLVDYCSAEWVYGRSDYNCLKEDIGDYPVISGQIDLTPYGCGFLAWYGCQPAGSETRACIAAEADAAKALQVGEYVDVRSDEMKADGCCMADSSPSVPSPVTVLKCPAKCDLAANITPSHSTIDRRSGGPVYFTLTITSSNSSQPFSWTLTFAGATQSGSANSSTTITVPFTITDLSDKLAEPFTDTAVLIVTPADSECPSASDQKNVTISANDEDCSKLDVAIESSLNVTSGNVNHTQTLFTVPNSKLMSDFTLTYNSRDGYSGVLGTGWMHNYNTVLQYNSTQDTYVLSNGSGGRTALYKNGNYYTSSIAAYPILAKNNDNTLTLTYKNGSVYNFNAQGKLTSIADKNGNALALTYDASSNLISIADSSGKTITLGYDASNRISSMADPNNNTYSLNYSGNFLTSVSSNNSLGTQTWTYTYGDKGFMLTKTDPQGNLFQYAYDANHRVSQTTDPQGKIRSIQYDPDNALTTVTEKDGGIWIYQYDTSLGVLTSKTDPAGSTTSFSYDTNRNLIQTYQDGAVTIYTYDANNNVTYVRKFISEGSMGEQTYYTYNDQNLVTSITDPNGNITRYAYDTNGNLTSIIDATNVVTAQYQYDTRGNISTITDALNNTTNMTYDQYNNLITVTDPKGGTVTMTYDSVGNVLSKTDALGNVTTFQYNSLNQMTQTTDPQGKITYYTYDYKGNRLSAIDANNNATQYVYDYKNHITQITDALNNITGMAYGGTGCTSCGSGVDKLTSLTDANNHTTTFEYDQAGNLIKETNPLGKITTYTYDGRGNVITRTNPDNKTIYFSYDVNNKLTQKSSDNSNSAFEYDDAGNMIYAGNQNIAYQFTYDADNRITQITESNGGTIQYQYDAAGNRTVMIMPDSRQITYAYDFNNLLTQINTELGNFNFSYDANNRRITRTLPNGTISTYSYDANSRLTGIQARQNSTTLDSLTYTLDNVGNRIGKTQNSAIVDYTYDNIYRLTNATPTGTTQRLETYVYDAVGNRLTKAPDTSPSKNETTQYSYDDENRLTGVQITQGGNVKQLTFAYDPFGRRISKTIVQDQICADCQSPNVCSRTTNYVYDGQNIIMEYDQNGNITAKYTHGPNIDEPLAVQQGTNTYYYHADGLGSITSLTNASGSIVQTYSYDSFGNITATGNIRQPFTYTAREYDSETGMYFYRARYYDPKVGRFVTKDPIEFGGGDVNLYGYVGNAPVNRTDPTGLYMTLFGPRFEGANGWPWYGGWPFNGSLWPGYDSQDNVCSYPVGFLNKNSCTKKCCKAHDDCYTRFGCNFSSILGNILRFSGACQMCNQQAAYCIMRNMGENDDCKCK